VIFGTTNLKAWAAAGSLSATLEVGGRKWLLQTFRAALPSFVAKDNPAYMVTWALRYIIAAPALVLFPDLGMTVQTVACKLNVQ
jgi:hypothetical protein